MTTRSQTPEGFDAAVAATLHLLRRRWRRRGLVVSAGVSAADREALSSLAHALVAAGATLRDGVAFEGTLHLACEPAGSLLRPVPRALQGPRGWSVAVHHEDAPPMPELPRDVPAREALPFMARWQLWRAASRLDDAAEGKDPEGIHQLRVSMRRMRSLLRLTDRKYPPRRLVDRFTEHVRPSVEARRDGDVGLDTVAEICPEGAPREALKALLEDRRARAGKDFAAALADPALGQTLRALAAPWPKPDAPKGSLRRAARARWRDEMDRLVEDLRGDLLHPGGYHEVRRRARRLRDLAELLGPWLKKRERAWRARLHPMQSTLGALQDLDVLRATLAESAGIPPEAIERLDARRTAVLAEVGAPLALLAIELGALGRR